MQRLEYFSGHAGQGFHQFVVVAMFVVSRVVQVSALRFDVGDIAVATQGIAPVIGNFFGSVPRPALDDRARTTVVVLGDDTKHAIELSGSALFEA